MPDPVLESARHLVGESLTDLRSSIEGLPVEALNWRPAGDDSNSLFVLATHTLHATRLWLCIAMGAPLPDRDRNSEFQGMADDAGDCLSLVDELSEDCRAALRSAEGADWAARRLTQGRGGDAPPEVTAAHALIHATEHLRGHVDQMSLTRRLWEQRSPAP
ncbi:MAG: DinB family protein [Dehalococcoidia bacterium]